MKILRYIALFTLAFILAACEETKREKPVVTVTIEPLRYFVEQIAGDRVSVTTLVPKGSSPETYEPTAQQMVNMSKSVMFVKVGNLGFERTWMEKLNTLTSHITIVDTSEGIEYVSTSKRGVTDEHTWMSTKNALVIAHNIYLALTKVDNSSSVYYKERYDSLVASINRLNSSITQKLKNIDNRSFIIYHPALTYFAQEYSLTQLALEEDGREPSAASLAKLITNAKKLDTKIMFVQKEFDNRNKEIITIETGVKTIDINPLDYNWDKQMTLVADALADSTTAEQQ
ncbi:MAG: zinc ABC transporter substrate-binding protein [Prevotella sp.]|nr:zinc ABC transporter substrate-binding protein [Prevotella sp.]